MLLQSFTTGLARLETSLHCFHAQETTCVSGATLVQVVLERGSRLVFASGLTNARKAEGTTRLETRTKESNIYASLAVKTVQRNESDRFSESSDLELR